MEKDVYLSMCVCGSASVWSGKRVCTIPVIIFQKGGAGDCEVEHHSKVVEVMLCLFTFLKCAFRQH